MRKTATKEFYKLDIERRTAEIDIIDNKIVEMIKPFKNERDRLMRNRAQIVVKYNKMK